MSPEMIDPQEYHQLFVDDYPIETSSGTTRTLHPPKKCGPVIRPDRSRGETAPQSRISPQWNSEKGIWEWWFGSDFATSEDGEHWDRIPVAERPRHAIRDERDPDPNRRYKGLMGSVGHGNDLGPAISADGIEWHRFDVPPIPSSDEHQFTYDPYTDQYLALVKHGTEWGRSVFLATSKDGEHYTDPELIFHTDEIDRQNRRRRVREVIENPAYIAPAIIDDEDYIAECYNMAVLPYQGFYIGFPTIFNPFGAAPPPGTNHHRINQIELTSSRDLYHWDRVADRALFIGIEPFDGENYGCSQLLMAGQPVVRDDGEIWCYYNALRMPSSIAHYKEFGRAKELFRLNVKPEHFEDSGALSLAKLRPDGFVSIDGGECGQILTKPFELKGEDVYINADATWGEIYAEIVDGETRRAHQGFSVPGEEPPPFSGDSTRAKIRWKHPHDLVFEKPVRLRFYLRQARLFSFWIE